MGLKSVQVRAGVGMKVVDGTLQRKQSLAKVPAKAPTSAGKTNMGPPGSISPATAVTAAGGAAGAGGGDAARMTPEFVRLRPALYVAAWVAMVQASAFEVDASGDVAPAFVQVCGTVLYCVWRDIVSLVVVRCLFCLFFVYWLRLFRLFRLFACCLFVACVFLVCFLFCGLRWSFFCGFEVYLCGRFCCRGLKSLRLRDF